MPKRENFTPEEVEKILTMAAEALELGAEMFGRMISAVPEVEKSQTSMHWVKVFAGENAKQLRETAKLVNQGK